MDSDPRSRRWVLSGLTTGLVAVAGCTTGDTGESAETTTATTANDDGSDDNGGDDGNGSDGEGTDDSDGDGSDGSGGSDETTADGTGTTATMTTNDGDLDLREANVTDVTFERRNGEYRFSVELYHDDDGEEGYANWWQVERTNGERLGRRTLLHAHSTRPFTRSENVTIPEDVRTVVVRGHDQTHGYGGQAAIVDLETSEVEYVRQGPEPRDFSDRG